MVTCLWLYLLVAAFSFGDFMSTDRHEGKRPSVLFNLFASLIWPFGIASTFLPKKWTD